MANLIIVCLGESHSLVTAQGTYESNLPQAGISGLRSSQELSFYFVYVGRADIRIGRTGAAVSDAFLHWARPHRQFSMSGAYQFERHFIADIGYLQYISDQHLLKMFMPSSVI